MITEADKNLLQLLVRVFNHSIQSYYHFPEVIIYGPHRMEPQEFELLLYHDFVSTHYTDTFGKIYHLNKKAEDFIHQHHVAKKRRLFKAEARALQGSLEFV